MLQRLHSGEKLVRHTQYRFAELSKVGGCNETILGAQQENGLSHSQSVGFFFFTVCTSTAYQHLFSRCVCRCHDITSGADIGVLVPLFFNKQSF